LVCGEALRSEGWQDAELSVVVTGDREIRSLNREYRSIDKETDVLSFPLMELTPGTPPPARLPVEDRHLGDIVISLERMLEQAAEYGHSWRRELAYLAVHGVLHLLGYDHHEEGMERHMRAREEAVLAALELGR